MSRPTFRFEPHLPVDRIFIDPENERRTMSEVSFKGLVLSVRRKGIITPVGVEEREDGTFSVVYGNRRVLASKTVGRTDILAKIYNKLAKEERYAMQVAENATKVKIPLPETAENLWGYYRFLIEEGNGSEAGNAFQGAKSYWDLPPEIRTGFSMARFSEHTGFSETVLRRAFHYVNLDERIKEMVKRGQTSFTFAQEVGRIDDRKEQYAFFERICQSRQDHSRTREIKSKDDLAKAVTAYLRSKRITHFSLSAETTSEKTDREYYRQVYEAARVLGNLGALMDIDPSIRQSRGKFKGNSTVISDLFTEAQGQHEQIRTSLEQDNRYPSVYARVVRQRRNVFDEFFVTNLRVNSPAREALSQAEYRLVPIDAVYADEAQPRQTFEEEKLKDLARTIEEIGLLSPPLVKPLLDGKFRLVVGHRRKAAAVMAGLSELEVLACDLTDRQCRELQYEEDIHEKVILSERAEKLFNLYLLLKGKADSEGRKYSLRNFTKEHASLGAATIYNAIVFASLPLPVKIMHSRGLLHYSAAVAVGEITTPSGDPITSAEQIDWGIEASLLGYNAKQVREKVTEERVQQSFIFMLEGKQEGRRRLVAQQIFQALQIQEYLLGKIKGKPPLEVMEAAVAYLMSYQFAERKVNEPQSTTKYSN